MEPYIIAAVQMNSQPDIDYNLDQAYTMIRDAAGKGASLVGLPENFSFLGNQKLRMEKAEEISERSLQFIKETAAKFGIYLLGGSFPKPAGEGKVYNRSVLCNPEGRAVAQYNKIHLFDVELSDGESYRESDYVKPGNNRPVVYRSKELGKIGMSICYDLRFPELYRSLIQRQAEILCIPSAFTATTGRDHWKPLLQARAIENTSYVFAPAQTGTHGKKRQTHGHSLILDPWGFVLAEAGVETGIITAKVDHDRLQEVRQQIPSLEHRVIS